MNSQMEEIAAHLKAYWGAGRGAGFPCCLSTPLRAHFCEDWKLFYHAIYSM